MASVHSVGAQGVQTREWAALAAVAAIIVAGASNVVATLLVPDVSFLHATISNVAAGPYDWVQDLGFYVLAAGLVALAWAMGDVAGTGRPWTFSRIAFVIMALALIPIAAVHEYGDGDADKGAVHLESVLVYGVGYMAAMLLATRRMKAADDRWLWINIATVVLWLALAAWYFTMEDRWYGLVERIVGAIMLVHIAVLALWVRSRVR